jgi:hypothetical protein
MSKNRLKEIVIHLMNESFSRIKKIELHGIYFHGTCLSERNELFRSLDGAFSGWGAVWLADDEEIAEEFSFQKGGGKDEEIHVVYRIRIESNNIADIRYPIWKKIVDNIGASDVKEAIPMLKKNRFDGWFLPATLGSMKYNDICIFNPNLAEILDVKMFIDGKWTGYADIAEAQRIVTRHRQEIKRKNEYIPKFKSIFETTINGLLHEGQTGVDFSTFPPDVLKTLENEYGSYYREGFDWNEKRDEFRKYGDDAGRRFNRWVKKQSERGFIDNLDKLIKYVRHDLILKKRLKIAEKALNDFEKLIIPVLNADVLVPQISKYLETALLWIGTSNTDDEHVGRELAKAFRDAEDILDEHGSIETSKLTPSEIFAEDGISYVKFEKFVESNPEYKGVFEDWNKLFEAHLELMATEPKSLRNTLPYSSLRGLYDFLVDFRKSKKIKEAVEKDGDLSLKKIKSFKTSEGKFSIYDISDDVRGRANMFTVIEDKNGWIVRNAIVPDELRRKGIATRFYIEMNERSKQKTGKKLRSSQPRKLFTGEIVHELSKDSVALWDSFVKRGLAKKIGEKNYVFL